MIEQILGWIGTFLFFYGVYALARKNVLGFYSNGIANILYGTQAVLMSNWPLLVCSFGLLIINIYGIYNWRKRK